MITIKKLINLKNRTAIITGGAGHLGQTFGEVLGELGANIVVIDINKSGCYDVAEKISNQFKVETLPLVVNLEEENQVLDVSKRVLEHFGRIDVLINNGAFGGTSELTDWAVPFERQGRESWRRALEVNLTAPFILIQSCLDALKKAGNGSIINIGSIYGLVGPDMRLYEGTKMGNPAAYGASKGGMIQFTRWLASALAPDIRVNSISPGGIWRNQSEDFVNRYIQKTPMGRMATEDDFKGAIAYLASDMSLYTTGQDLAVDGGWTAW
jgi:NAD(P)-dependent dehydrogenase (short-subunit alcohol dehydrogenase family)